MSANSKINEAADAVKEGTDKAADALKRSVREVNGSSDSIGDRVRDVADEFSDDLTHWAKVVSDKTRANPLLALGIAVAAGIVISKISRR